MKSSLMRTVIFPFAYLAVAMAPPSEASDTIAFLYEDYPPYTFQQEGKVVGTVVAKVEAIAAAAGLTVKWRQATFSRMLRSIANGKGTPPVCIAGYGTTPERAATSWISKPFAMSSGSGIAVLKDNLEKFKDHESIVDILTDKAISGAFLQGATYSDVQTPLIEAGRERHLFIGGDDNDLAVMVVRGRVDFAMVNPDQVEYLQRALPGGQQLVALKPKGMRPPGSEHILCSRNLPEGMRDRINEAIEALKLLPGMDAPERDTDQ